jgi:MoxR-like ATPase
MTQQKLLTEQECINATEKLKRLSSEINRVIFGQTEVVDALMIGLLARGHMLLEGLPGLGKTELVKTVARAVKMDVRRIQFTPDLLPGDITGNPMLQEENGKRTFAFQPGPLFANLVLADEINRASPKTQSALLEAMQERRVTVMGQSHELPDPFFVLATQNPIELEGTYPLPEAQLDRFLFKIEVSHGSTETLEQILLNREMGIEAEVNSVLTVYELRELIELARRIHLPEAVSNFIARIVDATHHFAPKQNELTRKVIRYGASPRAALGLASAARARALLMGRINASFEDVQFLAPHVLNHRLILDYSSRLEGVTTKQVIAQILESVRPLNRDRPQLLEEQR